MIKTHRFVVENEINYYLMHHKQYALKTERYDTVGCYNSRTYIGIND